jgi:hypothetical protein
MPLVIAAVDQPSGNTELVPNTLVIRAIGVDLAAMPTFNVPLLICSWKMSLIMTRLILWSVP